MKYIWSVMRTENKTLVRLFSVLVYNRLGSLSRVSLFGMTIYRKVGVLSHIPYIYRRVGSNRKILGVWFKGQQSVEQ